MMATLVHRGPDDKGHYISGSLGLGFRRLSIIDLEGGHQPMSDCDRSVFVVFNGEIYNFRELKKELEGLGHRFQTNCDTEVIVHGYKQWGVDVLDHLNGMFGLAVWDEKKRQLMLARDRMGIKLVYYKLEKGRLCFGSEIRPLLSGDDAKPELDHLAINLFLRYRYVPSPLTIFKRVRKLAPGTRLIADESGVRQERWWKFKPVPFEPRPSVEEAEEELLLLYKRAVKRQLVSDVPLGLLLSGGLDSGLLLALMNGNGKSSKTFTVGYGKSFGDDELTEAARTAEAFNAPNVSVQLDSQIFEESLSKIIRALEEPIASSSIVPMYHLCARAREEVKVVLMGQGPDELFGGYNRHLGVNYGKYWRLTPRWLRTPMSGILRGLPRAATIKRALYSLGVSDRMRRYQQVLSIMPGAFVDSLFREDVLPLGAGDQILRCWQDLEPLMEQTDELGGLQFLEVRTTLPDELLMYADKLSMAHGLEVRVPYLDQEIVEYTERLSAPFKVRHGTRKWLHRRVCRNFLPSQVIHRKKKGFAVNVVDEWFRRSLSTRMDGLLLDQGSLIYEFLRPEGIQLLMHDHRTGRSDNHKILFSLVVLEELLRNYSV